LDLDVAFSHADTEHQSSCPDIGPICQVRAEPPQEHHTSLWLTEVRLLGEYGIAEHFALQGLLPLRIIGTKTTYTDLAGTPIQLDYESIHHHNEALIGLGDAQLLLHGGSAFGAFRLGGRAGISFPIGKVQDNPFKLGELGLPHEHIEFGTGTFDPVLGLDVARDFAGWSLAAFGYTQVPLYQGPKGYQAGARVAGGITGSSSLGLTGPTFRLGVVALHEFPERWDGVVPTCYEARLLMEA
jgi:hypothetical protein